MRKALFIFWLLYSSMTLAAMTKDSTARQQADSAWSRHGIFVLNAGQTSFSNWAPGGDNQISINSILRYRLIYKKDSISWENHLDIEYGSIFYFERKPKKSNDKIYLSSKVGLRAGKNWNYSYYLNFNSQFAPGYKYPNDSVPISLFMAPGYFTMGLGMDYKPQPWLSVLLTPYTYRLTVVNDARLANSGAYGVNPAVRDTAGNIIIPSDKFKRMLGGMVKIQIKQAFSEKLSAASRIELFSSYNDKPFTVDVNWNVFANYKFTKKISLTFNLDVVYDTDAVIRQDINGDGKLDEVGPRTQVKEALGLGVSIDL